MEEDVNSVVHAVEVDIEWLEVIVKVVCFVMELVENPVVFVMDLVYSNVKRAQGKDVFLPIGW